MQRATIKFILVLSAILLVMLLIPPAKRISKSLENRPIHSLDYGRLGETIRNETMKQLVFRYKFLPSGLGGGSIDAVRTLSIDFETNKPLSIEELRVLIVNCEEIFLKNVNANRAIRPYLMQYPFQPSGAEVDISSRAPREELRVTRCPVSAFTYGGKVKYMLIRPDADTSKAVTASQYEYISEPYEEARDKVIKEGKLEDIASVPPIPVLQPHVSSNGLPEKRFFAGQKERYQDYTGPIKTQVMLKVVDSFGEELAKKNDMFFHGVGNITDNRNIQYGLIFHDFHKLTLDEGRIFATTLFNEFFGKLSTNFIIDDYNTYLREYSKKCTGTQLLGPKILPEQAGFYITYWDENMDRLQKPYLAQILFCDGAFHYYEADPQTQLPVLVFKESLAEAKAFLESKQEKR